VKKILITGHKGLLGSACVREFETDHEILTMPGIDLRKQEPVIEWFAINRPNLVIHCAAKVGSVKTNRDNPVDFLLDNLRIQNSVIECAHAFGVEKLAFIASSCMFPKDAQVPVEESSLFTGKFEDSVEAYAIAKIAGWRLCKAFWEQCGSKFITVAPANCYGIGDSYSDSAHVIPALIRRFHEAVKDKKPLEVWGNGTAEREFIFADDVAGAIRVLMDKWDSPEVVNVGTGLGTSIAELVGQLMLASPYSGDQWPQVRFNPSEPTGIPRKTFSVRNLAGLGWKPKYTLADGLHKTWFDFLNGHPRGM
jgi:GDP-L-fucose synthase